MKWTGLLATICIIFLSACPQHAFAFADKESFSSFAVTPTYSIRYSNSLSPPTVETIKSVMQVMYRETSGQELIKLKSFIGDNHVSNQNTRIASYDEAQCRIIIHTRSFENKEAEWETIAHEVGHSVIFSKLTPEELSRVAKDRGGWAVPNAPSSFYDHTFFLRYFGATVHAASFPSTYSYTNIHEWLAENFASYLVGKAHRKKPAPSSLDSFFDKLLR